MNLPDQHCSWSSLAVGKVTADRRANWCISVLILFVATTSGGPTDTLKRHDKYMFHLVITTHKSLTRLSINLYNDLF